MEDAIFVHDASTGEILDVNAKMLEMFGYSAEEARSLTVEDLGSGDPPYTQVEALRAIREASPGQSRLTEWQTKHKDGRRFWVEVNLKRCVMNSRETVLAVVRDITDRKKMEEAVRRERDKAQSYLDIAGVMIVVIDRDQKIVLANRKTCEVLGCEEKDIIGKNWFDTFIPEQERDMTKGVFRDLMAGNIEPWEYAENPLMTMSGEKRLIAWHNSVIRDENGRIVATLSSGEDITERKRAEQALLESEARFREFAEAVPQVVYELDARGKLYLSQPSRACVGRVRP